mmetsp:Transcript_49070/g.129651  ORF Transcript_49070/g.129651 Transcript_49070/m.129651 type:complete len:232 (-) Transcript_49070:375-1070(-)
MAGLRDRGHAGDLQGQQPARSPGHRLLHLHPRAGGGGPRFHRSDLPRHPGAPGVPPVLRRDLPGGPAGESGVQPDGAGRAAPADAHQLLPGCCGILHLRHLRDQPRGHRGGGGQPLGHHAPGQGGDHGGCEHGDHGDAAGGFPDPDAVYRLGSGHHRSDDHHLHPVPRATRHPSRVRDADHRPLPGGRDVLRPQHHRPDQPRGPASHRQLADHLVRAVQVADDPPGAGVCH